MKIGASIKALKLVIVSESYYVVYSQYQGQISLNYVEGKSFQFNYQTLSLFLQENMPRL